MTDQELQTLRNMGNEAEAAADEIETLRQQVKESRGLLLWALYHHQGGSSPVGQPIRAALGIGEHDHLTPSQVYEACDAAANAKTKAEATDA